MIKLLHLKQIKKYYNISELIIKMIIFKSEFILKE